jgi:sigma-B regulation protein RsbU (phosphoserine phosphatase)
MDDLARTVEKAIKQIDFVHASQKEHHKLEGLEKDLAAANQIQQFILPRVFPPFPEDSDKFDICASMVAAKDIGGDFYDFFRLDDDHIALVIADVCGKGIPAALYMAVSRTVIRTKGIQTDSPAVCMEESNHMLASYSLDYMFVTVFYAVYNTRTGLVTYCNAGHIPPHVLRADGSTEELPLPENMVIGLREGSAYQEGTLQLEHGDTLVMFTDGVTEAMRGRTMFGNRRLDFVLGGQIGNSSQQIIESIKMGISAFVGDTEQSDDITMLVLKRK